MIGTRYFRDSSRRGIAESHLLNFLYLFCFLPREEFAFERIRPACVAKGEKRNVNEICERMKYCRRAGGGGAQAGGLGEG